MKSRELGPLKVLLLRRTASCRITKCSFAWTDTTQIEVPRLLVIADIFLDSGEFSWIRRWSITVWSFWANAAIVPFRHRSSCSRTQWRRLRSWRISMISFTRSMMVMQRTISILLLLPSSPFQLFMPMNGSLPRNFPSSESDATGVMNCTGQMKCLVSY